MTVGLRNLNEPDGLLAGRTTTPVRNGRHLHSRQWHSLSPIARVSASSSCGPQPTSRSVRTFVHNDLSH